MYRANQIIFIFLLALTAFLPGCLESGTKNATVVQQGLPAVSATPTPTSSATGGNGPNAVQIIFQTGTGGSFNSPSVPTSGGIYNPVARVFDLSGNLISGFASAYPNWWFQGAGAFITSTSTSYPGGGTNATTSSSSQPQRTPCAYFDTYSDDNNPETQGQYTIDGVITNAPSLSVSASADMDQCAAITATEKSKLGIYVQLRRTSVSMNSTDKIQMIVKARPLTPPNTAAAPSSCIIGGLFDATACASTVFTLSMRSAIGASARPFYMLFPSAKSLDLISESLLLPVNIDSNITTISIDRLKGGAVFYSITLIRVP